MGEAGVKRTESLRDRVPRLPVVWHRVDETAIKVKNEGRAAVWIGNCLHQQQGEQVSNSKTFPSNERNSVDMPNNPLLSELTSNDVALKAKLLAGKEGCASGPPAKRAKTSNDLEVENARLTKENLKLREEVAALKRSLKAYEPSAEDVAERVATLRSSLSSKIGKAMSVWKNSCKGNGARFTVEVGCTPPVLAGLLGEKLFGAATKGAKANKPEISLVLNSTEKIITALGRVPYGSVRYSNLSLKVGKSAGLRMKLDKASNSLSVSGVYGTNFWGNE